MRFRQSKQNNKKRSHKRKPQRAGSPAQTEPATLAPIERYPALPDDPVFKVFFAQQQHIYDLVAAAAGKQLNREVAINHGLALIHLIAMRRCEHILLSPGVIEMLDDIFHDPGPYGLSENPSFHLPAPAWIKIEEANFTPFYEYLDCKVRGIFILDVFSSANLALFKQQAFARSLTSTDYRAFALLRDYVTLKLIGENGACLFRLEFQRSTHQWFLTGEHRCPYHACVVVAGQGRKPCERCEMALDLFSRWIPICMLALSGKFRQIELESNPRAFSQQKQGPGEKKQPLVRVVRTIDVSVRPARHTGEEEEDTSIVSPRGSWVERAKAIDPNRVKTEERDVPERKRTLSYPRYAKYIAKHGINEVTVRAHTRTIPLLNLPRTTRARAKRYDDPENQ